VPWHYHNKVQDTFYVLEGDLRIFLQDPKEEVRLKPGETFTAMIEGVREQAIKAGMIEPELFDAGIRALYRSAEADGVFCYTFFKAFGEKR